MAGRGEFTRRSKRQREPSTPNPRLRSKRHYGSDSVEAGWDHHFVHSSMQGMTINHVIFAKKFAVGSQHWLVNNTNNHFNDKRSRDGLYVSHESMNCVAEFTNLAKEFTAAVLLDVNK